MLGLFYILADKKATRDYETRTHRKFVPLPLDGSELINFIALF